MFIIITTCKDIVFLLFTDCRASFLLHADSSGVEISQWLFSALWESLVLHHWFVHLPDMDL